MREKIVNLAKQHIGPLLLAVALILVGHLWLVQHDANLLADNTVKMAEQQVKKVDADAKAKVTVLRKKAQAVKTPEQAVENIPDVADLPLHPVQSMTAPDKVEVDAVALYQNLNKCKQDGVNLAACSQKLELKQQEIDALKGKHGFWTRVKNCSARVGVGAASGGAFGKTRGLEFGAAIGAASCFLVKP